MLLAPVALECFSVLTRMPPPHRAPPDLVLAFLTAQFPGAVRALPSDRYLDVLRMAAASAILGGAVYDALIAATARDLRAELVSLDARAARTYRLVGAEFRLLA